MNNEPLTQQEMLIALQYAQDLATMEDGRIITIWPNSIHVYEAHFDNFWKYCHKPEIKEEPYASKYGNSTKRFFQVGNIEVFCLMELKVNERMKDEY
jgi:hypothetical protein